jgi:hypothetical protein
MGVGMDGVVVVGMERGGVGVACCLCLSFWGSWAGFYIQRIRLHRLGDRFLDGREGFGEADGAVVALVAVILGTLRLLILARDIILASRTGGDQGSGLELWVELLLGIWLGIEATDRSPWPPREAILGLEVILGATTMHLDGAIQAQALLQDTRAQALDRRHGGSRAMW